MAALYIRGGVALSIYIHRNRPSRDTCIYICSGIARPGEAVGGMIRREPRSPGPEWPPVQAKRQNCRAAGPQNFFYFFCHIPLALIFIYGIMMTFE